MQHSATAAALIVFLAVEAKPFVAEEYLQRARAAVGRSIAHRRQALELSLFSVSTLARVNYSELSKLERGRLSRGIVMTGKVDALLTKIERERDVARQARAS